MAQVQVRDQNGKGIGGIAVNLGRRDESRSPDGDGQARRAGDAASSQGSSSGREELLRDAPHADRSDAVGSEPADSHTTSASGVRSAGPPQEKEMLTRRGYPNACGNCPPCVAGRWWDCGKQKSVGASELPIGAYRHDALADVARELIAYYKRGGGCSNCGGLPHSTTCFVGRFEAALSKPDAGGAVGPPQKDTERQQQVRELRESMDRLVKRVEAGAAGPPPQGERRTHYGGSCGTTPFYLFEQQRQPEYDQGDWVIVWYDDLYDLARGDAARVPPSLSAEDVDEIVEGIEEFIISGDPAVAEVWQPCIDRLRAARVPLATPAQEQP